MNYYSSFGLLYNWGNVCSHTIIHKGNIEEGFKEAAEIFEDNFKTPKSYQRYLGASCHSSFTLIAEENLTFWTTSAAPFMARMMSQEALRIPMSKVRVIATNMGQFWREG